MSCFSILKIESIYICVKKMNIQKSIEFFPFLYYKICTIKNVGDLYKFLGFNSLIVSPYGQYTWDTLIKISDPESFMKTLISNLFLMDSLSYKLHIIKCAYMGEIKAPLLSPVGILIRCFDSVSMRTMVKYNFLEYMEIKGDYVEYCKDYITNFYIIFTIVDITDTTVKCNVNICVAYRDVRQGIYYNDSSSEILRFLQIPTFKDKANSELKVTADLRTNLLSHQVNVMLEMFNCKKFYLMYGIVLNTEYYYQYKYDEIKPLNRVDKQISGALVIIPAGMGKTLLILAYLHSLPTSSVIVVPNVLLDHYKLEIKKHFKDDSRFAFSIEWLHKNKIFIITRLNLIRSKLKHTHTLVIDDTYSIGKKSKLYSVLKNIKRINTWLFSNINTIENTILTELLHIDKFNQSFNEITNTINQSESLK